MAGKISEISGAWTPAVGDLFETEIDAAIAMLAGTPTAQQQRQLQIRQWQLMKQLIRAAGRS